MSGPKWSPSICANESPSCQERSRGSPGVVLPSGSEKTAKTKPITIAPLCAPKYAKNLRLPVGSSATVDCWFTCLMQQSRRSRLIPVGAAPSAREARADEAKDVLRRTETLLQSRSHREDRNRQTPYVPESGLAATRASVTAKPSSYMPSERSLR